MGEMRGAELVLHLFIQVADEEELDRAMRGYHAAICSAVGDHKVIAEAFQSGTLRPEGEGDKRRIVPGTLVGVSQDAHTFATNEEMLSAYARSASATVVTGTKEELDHNPPLYWTEGSAF